MTDKDFSELFDALWQEVPSINIKNKQMEAILKRII
jgi:hypothetical protein